jgi:hypothetical protein
MARKKFGQGRSLAQFAICEKKKNKRLQKRRIRCIITVGSGKLLWQIAPA